MKVSGYISRIWIGVTIDNQLKKYDQMESGMTPIKDTVFGNLIVFENNRPACIIIESSCVFSFVM